MLRNILSVVGGIIFGFIINMTLVTIGHKVFPPPAGFDVSTIEGFTAAAQFMTAKDFIFPFLAHSLGTLAGAFVAAKFGASHRLILAMIIGIITLIGGIAACLMIPAPMWFIVLDLVVAYIPMAYLGYFLANAGDRKV